MTREAMQPAITFEEDQVRLLHELTHGRRIRRRRFLLAAAALGVPASAYTLTPVSAQSREIVLVNWGGDAVAAMRDAFAEPWNRGGRAQRVVVDGAGPSSARIKAMVDSRRVTWDVCDRNLPASIELGQQGLLEEIDYSIVDRGKVRPEHAGRWGVGNYIFSFVLTWDTSAFGGRRPQTWADLWNLREFPGKRTLRRHIDGQLEAALLADGVPPEQIYPIDVRRALDKIRSIKAQTIFWGTGAESQQVFRDREVTIGNIFNTRASVVERETNGRVTFSFNQANAWVGAWIVPKGNPAGADAQRFIASTQDPAQQVELLKTLGNGPINPAAAPLVPRDLVRIDPGHPDNWRVQIPANAEWYAEHSPRVLTQFIEAIA